MFFRKLLILSLILAVSITGIGWERAHGQGSDEALKDRVAQLVERLSGPDEKAAKAAEEAFVKLGERVLPLLPAPGTLKDAKGAERLEKVRKAIRESLDTMSLDASKVTIQAKGMRLSEALLELQKQSRNRLTDLREEANSSNPAMDLDLKDVPFLKALDVVAQQAGLAPTFYNNDRTIGLQAMAMGPNGAPAAPMASSVPIQYSGPFRIEMLSVAAARDFRNGVHSASARFEVAWEPKLRPMLLKVKLADIQAIDDKGGKVEPNVMGESLDAPLNLSNPVVEMNLDLKGPAREALKIASLKLKGEVTVPVGTLTFKFPKLTDEGAKQTQDGVTVTLASAEVDELAWKIEVYVEYPQGLPGSESFRQGVINNQLWLQRPDGSRFEHNGGSSPLQMSESKLGFEYVFAEVPGKLEDYSFVFETPGKVRVMPLEFEFKDIPLP